MDTDTNNNEYSKLSIDQKYAFTKFTTGKNLFITGPGGTGKTRLIQQFVNYAKKKNKKVQVCALTGCATILLKCKARTIHSWSGIKLAKGLKDDIVRNVLKNIKLIKEWKSKDILIVDEISMMSLKIFEVLEEIARKTRNNSLPFGGLQVIFTGDFFQLPPVGTYGEPDTEKFCFESSKWFHVFPLENHIELKTIFRQKDPLYIEILSQIRKGYLDEEKKQILQNYVKREYDPSKHADCIPVKLFAIRSRADFVNNTMFEKLEEKTYEIKQHVVKNCKNYLDNGMYFSEEITKKIENMTSQDMEREIEFLTNNIPCQETLLLKKGAIVMCVFNVNIENGIYNGSQGIVIDLIESTQGVKPVVKFSNGVVLTMEKQYWQSEEYPCIAIYQIPLCLSWAVTIHKIQGSSMKMAEIDIGMTIFEYGQIYVALSRIESLEGLYLLNFNPQKIKANPKVIAFYENIHQKIYTEDDLISDFSKFNYKDDEGEHEEKLDENGSLIKKIEFLSSTSSNSKIIVKKN